MTDASAARPEQSTHSSSDTAPSPDRRAGEPLATPAARDPRRRTRTSSVWIGIIVFAVVLVLLLIFILQNTQSVELSFFAANGTVSLAVAMLLATVAGVLLTAIAGSLRIWQLRRRFPRSTRH